jgi:hypothetical protein
MMREDAFFSAKTKVETPLLSAGYARIEARSEEAQ